MVSVSQGKHRTGKSLGKGQCRRARVHARLHWELSTCLPRAACVTNERCGHRGAADNLPVPHQGVSSNPALPTCRCVSDIAHSCPAAVRPGRGPGRGPPCPEAPTAPRHGRQAVLRGGTCAQPSTGACCSQPSSPDPLGWGRQARTGLWLRGMQDRAGCNGGAQGDRAKQPSHLPCIQLAQSLPLPLPLPGTARCTAQHCARRLVSALRC